MVFKKFTRFLIFDFNQSNFNKLSVTNFNVHETRIFHWCLMPVVKTARTIESFNSKYTFFQLGHSTTGCAQVWLISGFWKYIIAELMITITNNYKLSLFLENWWGSKCNSLMAFCMLCIILLSSEISDR